MVKPIYCNLLLIFSCLIYEAYGGHHNVRHIRLPSRVIPNNNRPYDSSSSSTTINDAGENTATLESAAQPSSPHILRKSFSSNNGLGYDRNRGSVQDNKSSNYFGPYNLSSSSNTANAAGDDSAAQSSSSRLLKKSLSSNNGLGYDRNRGPVQNNKSSNYFGPYDLSSSSNTANEAGDDSAAQSSSSRLLKKPFSSNDGVGYDRNRGSVQDNKSSNYFGPYDLSSSSNTANAAGDDSAAQSSPSRLLKKSFSSNDGYGENRRSIQDMISSFSNNKPLSGLDNSNNSNDQIDTTLDDPSIQNREDSMNYEGINRIPLSGLNNRNMQNNNISENQGIGKRQNSIISDIQDFPNIRQTIINPLVRRLGSLRQNSLPPSLNEDDNQRISDGNENSSITSMINSNKSTFNDGGQKIVSMSLTKCCINNKCRMLKEGEKCDIEDYFKDMKNTKQQNGNNNFIMSKLMSGKFMPSRLSSFNSFGDSLNEDSNTQETEKPKNAMYGTSSNGDNDFIMPKLMDEKLKPFRLSSFNRFGDSFNEDGDTQETENPKNMGLGSTGFSTIFPSFGSSNGRPGMGMLGMGMPGMGSSFTIPEKKKPNYPYSEPIGVSEDEVNEIRNEVLQKSNFYRNKFELIPFTLDDQLNNCAQDWANNMAKQQLFDHRPDNVYGENLYGYQNLKNLGEIAVDSWYNEMSIFTIGNEENVDTFHMTQLLWKKSTKLGVGVSQNPENGMYYVVANYDPKGNLLEHFKENLPEITVEDIEEAKAADKKLKAKLAKPIVTSWSSGSSIPLGSGWSNYGSYFN